MMNQPLNNPVRTPTRRLIVRRPTPEMRIGMKVYADIDVTAMTAPMDMSMPPVIITR